VCGQNIQEDRRTAIGRAFRVGVGLQGFWCGSGGSRERSTDNGRPKHPSVIGSTDGSDSSQNWWYAGKESQTLIVVSLIMKLQSIGLY